VTVCVSGVKSVHAHAHTHTHTHTQSEDTVLNSKRYTK